MVFGFFDDDGDAAAAATAAACGTGVDGVSDSKQAMQLVKQTNDDGDASLIAAAITTVTSAAEVDDGDAIAETIQQFKIPTLTDIVRQAKRFKRERFQVINSINIKKMYFS
jgi:hypothetical protein